jgi:FtsP/CotA-like multicopper oxidase with cupredoxin domain
MLVLTDTYFAGDRYNVSAVLINGMYPASAIEGNWGDAFHITVGNRLINSNGTSIH